MVNFGLKLEDNRVSEWSDKYIDYNRLKLLIEKLADTIQKREILEQRNPNLAKVIREQFESSPSSYSSQSRSYRRSKSNELVQYTNSNDSDEKTIRTEEYGNTESISLLSSQHQGPLRGTGNNNSSSSLGGVDGSVSVSGSRSPQSTRLPSYSSLQDALSNVASYFKPNSYEDKLRGFYNDERDCKNLFARLLEEEIKKVELFYGWKWKEIQEQFLVLLHSVPDDIQNPRNERKISTARLLLKNLRAKSAKNIEFDLHDDDLPVQDQESFRVKEANSIKRAVIDLHRTSKLLLNYAILNYIGFVKITKKYRKVVGIKKAFEDDLNKINKDGKEAEHLAESMESKYATWFCGGNIREAQVQMLPKKGDDLDMDWSQLQLGYRLGMCAILTVWVCWDCIWGLVVDGHSTIGGRTAFPVFRGCGGLLLFHWFWGFSTFIWSRFRVNYIFLFDFNPRIIDTPMSIIGEVVNETLVYLILMLLYYKAGAHDMPAILPTGMYPFILVLYTMKKMFFPLRTRAPLWKAISRVVTAPLSSITFFETYVGDVFTSMVKVFQDLLWIVCFVASGDFLLTEEDAGESPHSWQHAFWYQHVAIPLICLAPLWIRLNQCLRRYYDTRKRFPHLANAFKYALSQTVTLFGAFHPLYLMHSHKDRFGIDLFQIFWMGLFVCSSLYSWCWDVYMDWGLGRPKFSFLGPRLMFPKRFYYYAVIFADLFLRFMWVLTLVPPQSGARFELPNYLNAITMAVELFRRTIWGFFRLENEHRCNTEQFRRVDFVPLHFDTGHSHKYKKQDEKRGWGVLAEVLAVTVAVVAVSISSIIAASNATANVQGAI